MPTNLFFVRSTLALVLSAILLTVVSCGGGDSQPDTTITEAPEPLSPDRTPPPDSDVVARWNGGTVYLSEIDAMIQPERALETIQLPAGTDPADYVYQQRSQTIETLINNYLLIQEARKRGLSISEPEKEQLLRNFKGQFRTEDEYTQNLAASGQTEDQLVAVLANIALGRKCVEDQQRRVMESLTPQRKQKYYEENIAMFTPPARSAFNRVVIEANETRSREDAKALATTLHAQAMEEMAELETFKDRRKVIQDMAVAHSDAPEAQYNYGYCLLYHMPNSDTAFTRDFLDELSRTPIHALSGVVQTASGYGFFLMQEKTESFIQPFDSDTVQKMLPRMMLQAEMEAWHNDLMDTYDVWIDEEKLRTWPNPQP